MGDDDRTLIQDPDGTLLMPAPGGQATVVLPRRTPAKARKAQPGVELQRLVAGINPLLGAANVLLALATQLRATMSHADPAVLRAQMLERVAEFEALCGANGVPRPQVSAARYVLCTFLDEVIAATPWGAAGVWAERNLLQEFHDERWGGQKAFDLLERLGEDPVTNAGLLELFYVCLALGFEGRYRGVPNGRAQLDAIAARVLEIIRPSGASHAPRTLSLRWQGVARRDRRLSVLPLWVVFAVAGSLLLAIVLLLGSRLDDLAGPVFRRIHAVPGALQVDRGALAAKARVAPLLQADIARGAVEVRDEALRSVVTLPADALFTGGGTRIDARQLDLLGRVAQALSRMPGQVAVVGHTDDSPTASLQYPSNWHLSRARAQSVMAVLAARGARGERLHAEGRADAEPLAPNQSVAARARNRRIEIELRLPRPDV